MFIAASQIMLFILGVLSAGPPTPESSEQHPPAASEPAVSIRRIDAHRAIISEHQGPYWTMGRTITTTKDQMVRSGQVGPMFVLYPDNTERGPSMGSRIFVGFYVGGNFDAKPPLAPVQLPAVSFAVLIAKNGSRSIQADSQRLRQWARLNNKSVSGPVMEVFCGGTPPSCDPVDWNRGPSYSEIRLALGPTGSWELPFGTKTEKPATRVNEIKATPPADRNGNKTVRAETEPPPVTAEPVAKESRPVQAPKPTTHPVANVVHTSDLLAKGDDNALAEELMPEAKSLSSGDIAWLRRFVPRVLAATDGITQRPHGASKRHRQLHEAIRTRYRRFVAETSEIPLPMNIETGASSAVSSTKERPKLMRSTDDLLAEIAVEALPPDEAFERLCAILDRSIATLEFKAGQQHSPSTR